MSFLSAWPVCSRCSCHVRRADQLSIRELERSIPIAELAGFAAVTPGAKLREVLLAETVGQTAVPLNQSAPVTP